MRAHSCVRQGVWNIGRSRCDGKRSNASSGRVARRVFADNLLKRLRKNLPREYLDVLLNVARLWVWKTHDNLEEVLTVCLGLGYRQWAKSL
jgi:hypothetical protein